MLYFRGYSSCLVFRLANCNCVAYNTNYEFSRNFFKSPFPREKLTQTRKAIIEMVVGSHVLLSVPEILKRLETINLSVNKTTVYREIAFLLENKIVNEVILKSGATHYESAFLSHHHHITCTLCGNIQDIESQEMEMALQNLELQVGKNGFQIHNHSLEFSGVCLNCQ